jgi:hypothetical protein
VAYSRENVVIQGALILLAAATLLPRNAMPSTRPSAPFLAQAPAAVEPAQPPAIDLEWDVPPGCPDSTAVRAEVLRLTGPTTQGSRHLKASASILPTVGGTWTLSLATNVDGVIGERILSGGSCESLADAAALMLALILNPDLVVAKAPDPPPPPVDAATPPAPRPRWQVGAYGGIQTGAIETMSSTFALSLGIAFGRLSLRLMPGLSLPQDVFVDTDQKLGGRLWTGTAGVLGCYSEALGFLQVSPCVGFDVTRLAARGLGVLRPREATVYWSSAEAALLLALPVGYGVQVELAGIGVVPLHRPTVYLDDIGPVSRPRSLGLKALGGLTVLF